MKELKNNVSSRFSPFFFVNIKDNSREVTDKIFDKQVS
jgi:hypothetical protein